jgi:acetoin utilization deacetylase AcuC-like enzyme
LREPLFEPANDVKNDEMTLFYYDPKFMEHITGNHPENATRILPTVRHLHFLGLDSACNRPAWTPASIERLEYVHTPDYIKSIELFAKQGGGLIEQDTVLSPLSYDVARLAAGAVCDATARVIRGEDKNAFCLVRPPGHHAMADHSMGFCIFNNVAIGAQVAVREFGLDRVLIVDWDVHHGNGTQAIFWNDARVGFFSMHRDPFYPGTGAANEIGAGEGLGTTCNVPMPYGTPHDRKLAIFRRRLNEFSDRIKPQLIFISAGFDAHKEDPIGSLGLEAVDFAVMTNVVLEIANKYTGGKVISVLEGGYNPDANSDCIEAHLQCLIDATN